MISEKNFFVKSFETFLLRNCYNLLFINYIKGLQGRDGWDGLLCVGLQDVRGGMVGGVRTCGMWCMWMWVVWLVVCGFEVGGVAGRHVVGEFVGCWWWDVL